MSQPRPAERIEMEKGSVIITGERKASTDFHLRVRLSGQACNIAILVPEATMLSL